jgi:hypothetical protein
MIETERLAKVLGMTLKSGAHPSIKSGACVMEAVAYVAGEKWSDAPECASPVIAAFMRLWNDSLDDEARNRLLKPLIPRLVDTKGTPKVEERRSYMALDWLIRVFTPKWLDMVPALHEHAKALRELEAIADMAGAAAAGKTVHAAEDAAVASAWAAARAAAGAFAEDAAVASAWAAARAAAEAAARAAAEAAARAAAVASAWAAARAAAEAATRAAAEAAARDVLRPTTEWLQASALQLVDRMLEATP